MSEALVPIRLTTTSRLLFLALVVAACGPAPVLGDFETDEASVDDVELTVVVAESSVQRQQGLQGVEELPAGIDGMLFAFDEPTSTTFHMQNVAFPLDIWFFGADGRLLGSARMDTCGDVDCISYSTPGEITWAVETPADVFDFGPGSVLSVAG